MSGHGFGLFLGHHCVGAAIDHVLVQLAVGMILVLLNVPQISDELGVVHGLQLRIVTEIIKIAHNHLHIADGVADFTPGVQFHSSIKLNEFGTHVVFSSLNGPGDGVFLLLALIVSVQLMDAVDVLTNELSAQCLEIVCALVLETDVEGDLADVVVDKLQLAHFWGRGEHTGLLFFKASKMFLTQSKKNLMWGWVSSVITLCLEVSVVAVVRRMYSGFYDYHYEFVILNIQRCPWI